MKKVITIYGTLLVIALVLITTSCSKIVFFRNEKLKKVKVDKIDELVEASIPSTRSDSSFNQHFNTEPPGINSVLKEKRLVASTGKIQVQNLKKESDKFFTPEIYSGFTQNRISNKPSLVSQINNLSSGINTKKTSIEDRELKTILVILIVAGITALLAVLTGTFLTLSYVLMTISICALTIAVCLFFKWLFNRIALNLLNQFQQ